MRCSTSFSFSISISFSLSISITERALSWNIKGLACVYFLNMFYTYRTIYTTRTMCNGWLILQSGSRNIGTVVIELSILLFVGFFKDDRFVFFNLTPPY